MFRLVDKYIIIEIDTTKEILKWCVVHFGHILPDNFRWHYKYLIPDWTSIFKYKMAFYFKNKEDAILFNMVWT